MIINAIKLIGLLVLTGGPLFYVLVCRQIGGSKLAGLLHRHISRLIIVAGGLYLFSTLLSGLVTYLNLHQLDVSAQYLNFVFVPFFIICFLKAENHHKALSYACLLVLGLVVMVIHSTTSHAAAQAGFFPVTSNVIHLIAAAFWGGGLMSFASLLWTELKCCPDEYLPELRRLAVRFSRLTIISFMVMLVSGSILAVSNVHSLAAFDSTQYGTSLKLKLLFVILLLCLFIYDLLKTVPGLNKADFEKNGVGDGLFDRCKVLVLSMSLTAFIVIAATGIMVTFTPPDTAPFLTPQTWRLNAGQYPVQIEVQPVAGSSNRIRFELFVPDELMQPSGMLVNYSLYIPQSSIGVKGVEAIQVSQNSFQGEVIFPMPGSWRFELELYPPSGSQLSGEFDFELPALPLVEDLRTYLSYSSVVYSPANKITFIVGLLLLIIYGWLTWRSQSGKISRWISVAGLVGISIGIFLVMTVTLVKTYPSTYWENPQSYTAVSISQGHSGYKSFCEECHGQTGVGDGPWAVENRGLIPSLSSPHMDIHTDGEIYWWITYGIPSLEMPALEEELTETMRWQVINFIRSLRHGIPQ
jgi:putative copper export protein/mono/diheme cytochrome c family protein